jgi:hypothetical protein
MKHVRNITLLLIIVFASLFLLETSLRLLRFQLVPLVSQSNFPYIYVEDSQTGYRYAPNSTGRIHRNFEMDNVVKINSKGFHDIEHTAVQLSDKHKIVAIGDSFTAAVHVQVEDTWTQVLGRELRQLDDETSTEVVNLGLDSTGTDIQLMLLRQKLATYEPDIVILAFYRNDIRDLQRRKRFRECYEGYVLTFESEDQKEELRLHVDTNRPGSTSRWLFDNIYLFRLANWLLGTGELLSSNNVSPSILNKHIPSPQFQPHNIDKYLMDLKYLSEKQNFRLLIIPVPAKDSATDSLQVLTSHASPEVLADLEIIDISKQMDDLLENKGLDYSDLFWTYDGHFNEAGNELFGAAVATVLQANH